MNKIKPNSGQHDLTTLVKTSAPGTEFNMLIQSATQNDSYTLNGFTFCHVTTTNSWFSVDFEA